MAGEIEPFKILYAVNRRRRGGGGSLNVYRYIRGWRHKLDGLQVRLKVILLILSKQKV